MTNPQTHMPPLARPGGSVDHQVFTVPRLYWPPRKPWPQTISGLALPNGVFLSDGVNNAGAGTLGLMLAGFTISGIGICSIILTYLIAYGLQRLFSVPLVPILLGTYFTNEPAPYLWIWEIGLNVVKLVSFLVLMRLSPLTGYHAAEHQTVHAIETGKELTLDLVKNSTPVHRRCGSNLVGPIFVIIALSPLWWPRQMAPGIGQATWWLGQWPWLLVIAPLAWRFRTQIGGFLQKHFLTKKPTDKQLLAGIESGRLLIHRHRLGIRGSGPKWPLWQRGIPQVTIGLLATGVLAWWVNSRLLTWLDF